MVRLVVSGDLAAERHCAKQGHVAETHGSEAGEGRASGGVDKMLGFGVAPAAERRAMNHRGLSFLARRRPVVLARRRWNADDRHNHRFSVVDRWSVPKLVSSAGQWSGLEWHLEISSLPCICRAQSTNALDGAATCLLPPRPGTELNRRHAGLRARRSG